MSSTAHEVALDRKSFGTTIHVPGARTVEAVIGVTVFYLLVLTYVRGRHRSVSPITIVRWILIDPLCREPHPPSRIGTALAFFYCTLTFFALALAPMIAPIIDVSASTCTTFSFWPFFFFAS